MIEKKNIIGICGSASHNSANIAKEFAKMKSIPEILDNGYDNSPNPYTEKDAITFIEKQIGKSPEERFLIY